MMWEIRFKIFSRVLNFPRKLMNCSRWTLYELLKHHLTFLHINRASGRSKKCLCHFQGGAKSFCCLLQSKHLMVLKLSLHNQTRQLSKEKKKSFLEDFISDLPAGTRRKQEAVQATSSTGDPEAVWFSGPLLTPTVPSPSQVSAFTASLFWTTGFLPFPRAGTSPYCLSLARFPRDVRCEGRGAWACHASCHTPIQPFSPSLK